MNAYRYRCKVRLKHVARLLRHARRMERWNWLLHMTYTEKKEAILDVQEAIQDLVSKL